MRIKILILLFPVLSFSQKDFSSSFFSKENVSFKKVADSLSPKIYEYIYPISENRAVFRTYNEKMGVMDSVGKVIIKPRFNFIGEFRENRAEYFTYNLKAQKGHIIKRGVIDEYGNIIVEPKYDHISYFENGVSIVHLNSKYNVIDRNGREFFLNNIDNVIKLSDKLIGFEINGKYGIIDINKIIIKEPFFDKIDRFNNNFTTAYLNNIQYVINENAEVIFECNNIEIVSKFNNGFWIFRTLKKNEKISYGLIDNKGNIVVEAIYDYISLNRMNFYSVVKNEKCGVIDRFSKLIIPTIYEKVHFFTDNILIFKLNGFEGLINVQNQILLPNEYQFFYKSNKKIFANHSNSSGEINLADFTFKPSLSFEKIIDNGDNSAEYFIIQKENKFGLINENQQIIVPIIYDEIKYPLRKIVAVKLKDKYGVIDITNKILKPIIFTNISQLKAGYLLTKNKSKERIYDSSLQ